MKILITNDDGILSPGIQTLAAVLREIGDVAVVAPDRERSAVSHALTLHQPLRATRLAENTFAVDGTPTDCVNLGIHQLLTFRPDIIVSGINRGANLGDDISYSGTVSAAMEATLMGIPAFAISLASIAEDANYDAAAAVALKLVHVILDKGLPPDTFLNVNVPDLPATALLPPVVTTQGKRRYEGMIINKVDPRGRNYYWIGSVGMDFLDIDGSDYSAVSRGHVSITPLHLDLTNYKALNVLKKWQWL
ncbi:5'/3'-nucleotidase SurE [Geobacter sp. DSM 9736]|uniref:5'/3'-nucleotidase SurE n=1 Tax=Geobacter sp. DSM 9736 TaxID=1277350 RepID=UPI000B4FFEF3|nr:5'/3'-nucleotidase SurE [Geobacter sp. DSM 9736]